MYTLMLGGAALSVTGIVLSIRWLARGIRRLFRRKKKRNFIGYKNNAYETTPCRMFSDLCADSEQL